MTEWKKKMERVDYFRYLDSDTHESERINEETGHRVREGRRSAESSTEK